MIFLVRHAKAGHRSDSPDDFKRPLSKNGHIQAELLVELLIAAGATGPLISSPFARCIQTLEPLAVKLDQQIQVDARLAEASPVEGILDLIETAADGSVMSSHGDMIPDTVDALIRRGCEITTPPYWKKGSVWVLTRDQSGAVVSAASWPPPAE